MTLGGDVGHKFVRIKRGGMKKLLKHKTRAGTFYIAQSDDGRFHPVYDDESLGSYASIAHAVDDLVHDATWSVLHQETGALLDTSDLGLPEDPTEWTRINHS